MVIDKNYFLNRLANGENMDAIGAEIAAMMTDAMNEHKAQIEAEKAKAEKENTKRHLVEELVDIVKELAVLEGMDPNDLQISNEDMDQMVVAITDMLTALGDLKNMLSSVEANIKLPKIHNSDEQILADFIKMFN